MAATRQNTCRFTVNRLSLIRAEGWNRKFASTKMHINFINFNKINRFANYTNLIGPPLKRKTLGAFHSTQNSGNFGSGYIKWNGPFRFDPTQGIFKTSFEVVDFDRSFRSILTKFPFPFVKLVVPSTSRLYPAYKNNYRTRGGLVQVCATGIYRSIRLVKFPKFPMGIFVQWKVPSLLST